MISSLRPHSSISLEELAKLEARMIDWYKSPPKEYYEVADFGKDYQNPLDIPYHLDLLDQIPRESSVCEFGCGSGLFGRQVLAKGARYTGLEWSPTLLEKNRQSIPLGNFHSLDQCPDELFDVVYSQYVIEHTCDPQGHLKQMWDHCKPGGYMGIICPDFINCGTAFPNSFFFGKRALRLREKIKKGYFLDALIHLLEWHILAKRWRVTALANPSQVFWMNTRPIVLENRSYSRDADAVYLPRLEEIESWITDKGGRVIRSSRMIMASDSVKKYNMYVLAQK